MHRYWEVDEIKDALVERISDAATVDAVLTEAVHAAAFYDTETLGRPTLASVDDLATTSAEDLGAFVDAHYVAGNMTIVGAGVRHKDLVRGKRCDVIFFCSTV